MFHQFKSHQNASKAKQRHMGELDIFMSNVNQFVAGTALHFPTNERIFAAVEDEDERLHVVDFLYSQLEVIEKLQAEGAALWAKQDREQPSNMGLMIRMLDRQKKDHEAVVKLIHDLIDKEDAPVNHRRQSSFETMSDYDSDASDLGSSSSSLAPPTPKPLVAVEPVVKIRRRSNTN